MADEDVPEFPPVKPGPTLKEMYERDAKSPWHKTWGGITSADARRDLQEKLDRQEKLRSEAREKKASG